MNTHRFFLSLLAAAVLALAVRAGTPTEDLAQQVTIRRTAYGVPHILAENERAAGFGMGFVQAEDHALNIMRSVLSARGEQAKWFGTKKDIEEDLRSRQFRVYARAVETYHLLDADWREMIEGFAEGFNYWVELHRPALPEWVGPINGHDVAAHGQAGVMRFAFDRSNIVEKFIKKFEGGGEAVVEPEAEGSNMWAFAPRKTKSGKAILMGNPHQPWSPVATYYEAHVTIPGKYNVYGTTFVGRPVITAGFNDHLGWSHTVNYPDLEEIYALDVDPDHADHYLFDGGSVPLTKEDVTIQIKTEGGLVDGGRTFWHTPLGPVVYRTAGTVYVLKSACYEEYRSYGQWYRMGLAKDLDEFMDALRMLAIPMFNVCYADKSGNIFYLWNGTVPNIPLAAQTDSAVHVSTSDQIWTKFHALDELPQVLNPEAGYVFNSNSPPYLTVLEEPMDPAAFPPHFGKDALSLRSQLSLDLVHSADMFSLEDIVKLKFDMRALLAYRVKDDLIAAVLQAETNSEVLAAAQLLKDWDNRVSTDSRGSVLFKTWWGLYSKDHTDAENFATQWSRAEATRSPCGLADTARAVEAFKQSIASLKEKYGSYDVLWGAIHRVRFGSVDVPVGGDGNPLGCFRIIDYREDDDGIFIANGGDSSIFAVEFGEIPRAYSVVAYSQSEVESAPHYNDQAALFADNQMKRVAFTEADIEQQFAAKYHPGETN